MIYIFRIVTYLSIYSKSIEENKLHSTSVINIPIIYLSINFLIDIEIVYNFWKYHYYKKKTA